MFNGSLYFNKVGIYNFNVLETSADGKGITTDKTVYEVVVTVTDNGGQLKASYDVLNAVGEDIIFSNNYKAADVTHTIWGKKVLNGRVLVNDEFTFRLSEAEEDGSIPADARNWEAGNFSDGHFAFDPLTFTEIGEYYYVVSEVPASVAHGIQFDQSKFLVKITVTDNGEGNLTATQTMTEIGASAVSEIEFINEYIPSPAKAHDTPDNPDTPDDPDTPDNPDTPDDPDTPSRLDAPPTGDDFNAGIWIVLIIIAVIGVIAVVVHSKKKD